MVALAGAVFTGMRMRTHEVRWEEVSRLVAQSTAVDRYVFKVVMLGDFGVGKTCLIKRCVLGIFLQDYRASIGVDVSSHLVQLDHAEVRLQIWDMSGQHVFRQLRRQYLSGADCAVIVFDVTRRSSLDGIPFWIEETRLAGPPTVTVLVGNKADSAEARTVTADEGTQAAKSYGLTFYTETSAKSGDNVTAMFQELAQLTLDRYQSRKKKRQGAS
jgi:Ras-related protein Rab-2A